MVCTFSAFMQVHLVSREWKVNLGSVLGGVGLVLLTHPYIQHTKPLQVRGHQEAGQEK